jgi:hypothetical protein
MPSTHTYWIINLAEKKFQVMRDIDMSFFSNKWREKTVWPDSSYLDLTAQPILPEQAFDSSMFYNYDLTYDGIIMAVYYDMEVYTEGEAAAFVEQVKKEHDVLYIQYHPLVEFV